MKRDDALPKQQVFNKKHLLITSVILLIILHMSIYVNAQDERTNDGPYVLYSNDSIIVKNINAKRRKPKVITQNFLQADRKNIVLQVNFIDHSDWDFTVQLKPELTNEIPETAQPEKLLALSDIEGEFEALRDLLIANNVMDTKYNWIFGKGHVVLCGDLFDRGSNVLEVLWLLYKLEQDSKANGGYFHTILGNHDIMNMSGDFRYVQPKYIANAALMGMPYEKLFDADTELGRWLRTKNIIEKIGDNLCLHAGVSARINELQLPLAAINDRARPYYDKAENDEVFDDKNLNPFFADSTSPFWYRGYFTLPKASQSQVDSTLELYKCKQVIVGHTIAPPNVAAYYQNKVIGIDVNQHEGKHEGILFENEKWYIINTTGKKKLLIE